MRQSVAVAVGVAVVVLASGCGGGGGGSSATDTTVSAIDTTESTPATTPATVVVPSPEWSVTFAGTHTELMGEIFVDLVATAEMTITEIDGELSGAGTLYLDGTVTDDSLAPLDCDGPLNHWGALVVTGTLDGTGPNAVLLTTLHPTTPERQHAFLTCTRNGQFDGNTLYILDRLFERFGELLLELALPAAGGTVTVSKSGPMDPVDLVTIEGTFTVTVGLSP